MDCASWTVRRATCPSGLYQRCAVGWLWYPTSTWSSVCVHVKCSPFPFFIPPPPVSAAIDIRMFDACAVALQPSFLPWDSGFDPAGRALAKVTKSVVSPCYIQCASYAPLYTLCRAAACASNAVHHAMLYTTRGVACDVARWHARWTLPAPT